MENGNLFLFDEMNEPSGYASGMTPFVPESREHQECLGQYPTPMWAAEALVQQYFPDLDRGDLVLEPSCGPGRFLQAIPAHVPAVGIELDPRVAEQARVATGRRVITGDFATVALDFQPTAIIGNPPFQLDLIDRFLKRAHALLPGGGRVGFILPAYAFQTAARVERYHRDWSIAQSLIPRNIFQGLSKPLVFALFSKDHRRTLIGFALYHLTAEVQQLADPYQEALREGQGPVWRTVVDIALERLGGEASLQQLYAEIQGHRPTRTQTWKEQIRRVFYRWRDDYVCTGPGRYALP